jgi:hypothetical protein
MILKRRNFIRSIIAFPFFKKDAIDILSKISNNIIITKNKNVYDFSKIAFPLIRKMDYQLLSHELLMVTPMENTKMPYYFNYKYEKN